MSEFDQVSAKRFLNQLTGELKSQQRRAQASALIHAFSIVVSMALLAWWVASSVAAQTVLWAALPWLLLALTARLAAAGLASRTAQQLAEAAQYRVRHRLMARWCEADSKRPSAAAERANLLVEPTEQLYGYYARFIPQLTMAVAAPLMIAIVVLYHDWIAALFLIVSAPIIPVFMALVGIGAARLSDRHIQTTQRLAGLFVDRVRHLTNLKLFSAEVMAIDDIRSGGERMREANMATLRVAFLSSAVLEFFSSVAIAAVAIYVGFALLGYFSFGPAGEMTFLAGFTVLLLAPDFFQPLRNLSAHYHDRASALAAAGVLQRELKADALTQSGERVEHEPTVVVLDRLSFGYQRAVIEQLSLQLDGGAVCLLNGPSGSGKSTLLKLLSGQLQPSEGRICVPRDTHIAYMAQEPYVQAGTLADNLRLVCATASDTELRDALQQAQLNKPLEHPVGERGQGLSGGEQRRLALARMFLHPAKLMLFDEPTAGLDSTTAALVTRAIAQLRSKERVLIVASHDPAFHSLATQQVGALR